MFKLRFKKPQALPESPPQLENIAAVEGHARPEAMPVDQSVVSGALEAIKRNSEITASTLEEIKDGLKVLNQHREHHNEIMERCVIITNEYQRNIEKSVNHELQRHVLYPAIESVALLADHISQLGQEIQRIIATHQLCELFGPLQEMIAQSEIATQQQMEHLGMHWIRPNEFEKLDAKEHDIKQAIDVNDKNIHGKIKRTLIAGLAYRGTVLRRAQVAVYCYGKKQNPSLKGNQNEGS